MPRNGAQHPNWRIWVDREERSSSNQLSGACCWTLADMSIGLAVLLCLVLFRRWIDPRLAALGEAVNGTSGSGGLGLGILTLVSLY